jgi:BASS family bile acid:Na+ symporter
MMATPALATILGLDATPVLVILITSTALIPLTAPLFAYLFIGSSLSVSPALLAVKLFTILTGAAFLGLALRRVLGLPVIERHKEVINGFNVLILFVFVAAIMESVGGRFLAAPMTTLALGLLAFVVFFALFLATALLFWSSGREHALSLAFMASQRNMGLMIAATGGVLPELTWLYFALSQFPIYLSPQLLQPLVQRVLKQPVHARGNSHEQENDGRVHKG